MIIVPPKPAIRPADCTASSLTDSFIKGFIWCVCITVPFIILWTFFFTALTVNSIRRDVNEIKHAVKAEKQK